MDMLFLNMRLDAQWCMSCFFDWLSFIFGMVEVASWKLRYRPSQRHIKWDVVFGLDNGCCHEVHLSYAPTFFYQHVHIPCSYIRSKLSSKIHDSNIATDKHLEPPLEKVNKQVGFRDPSLRTLLNKSTLRTFFFKSTLRTPTRYNIVYDFYIYIYKLFFQYVDIYIYI